MKNTSTTEPKKGSFIIVTMFGLGAAAGVWAIVAFAYGLAQVDWRVSELARQYFVAVGAIGHFETLVEYYTHIKGIEYIIAVAFLGVYPAFYKYVNRTRATLKA